MQHHEDHLLCGVITTVGDFQNIPTFKDILATASSGNVSSSACAAWRYRSWVKLHMSRARLTSHPSEIAICRPLMDFPMVADSSLAVDSILAKSHVSTGSSPPSLPLDQSIIRATSVTLNLLWGQIISALCGTRTDVAPKKSAQTIYILASSGSLLSCITRYVTSLGSDTTF